MPQPRLLDSLLRLCALPLALLGFGAATAIGQPGDGASGEEYRLYAQAERLFQTNKFRAAIDYYDQASRLSPGKFQYYFKIGNCYALLKEPANAVMAFKRSVMAKPDHLPSIVRLAYLSEQLERLPDAIAYYGRAYTYTADPKEKLEIKLKIIDLLYEEDRHEEAAPHIEDARSVAPDDLKTLYYALHHYNLVERYEKTVEAGRPHLGRFQRMSGEHRAKFFYEVGYAYYRLGEFEKARILFKYADHGVFAKLIEKTTAEYHFELAKSYAEIYDYPAAKRFIAHALEIKPGYAEAGRLRRQVDKAAEGDPERAVDLLNSADQAERDPQRAVYLRQLCELQLQSGQPREALATAERCLQMQQYDYIASFFKAVALYKLGQLDAARELMEILVNYSGIDQGLRSKYNFFLGTIYEAQEDYRRAISVYRMATYGSYKKAAEDQLMILVKRRKLAR